MHLLFGCIYVRVVRIVMSSALVISFILFRGVGMSDVYILKCL